MNNYRRKSLSAAALLFVFAQVVSGKEPKRIYVNPTIESALNNPSSVPPETTRWIMEQADLALKRASGEREFNAGSADRWAHDALFPAIAFRLTHQPKYAETAKKELASLVHSWSPTNPYVTDNNSLDFGIAMLSFVLAYDIISPELSTRQKKAIESKLFGPAAEAIRRNAYERDDRQKRSNHRTWQNAAVAAMGLASNRTDLVTWAISDPSGGFEWQMQNAFGRAGLQWEGSPRYQIYALAAMLHLSEAIENSGRPSLWSYRAPNGNQLQTLFSGLIQVAETNGRLPNVNARQQESLQTFASLYKIAELHTQDPTFQWLVNQSSGPPVDRPWTYVIDVLAALQPNTSTRAEPPVLKSDVESELGWATLRAGSGSVMGKPDPLYALFKFSRFGALGEGQGSAHEHPDKGLLEIRANNQQWATSRTRQNTSDALYAGFDRQTVAKNTVVIDGRSQPGGRGAFDSEGVNGQLMFVKLRPFVKIVQAKIDSAYKQLYRRTVAVIGDPQSDDNPPYVIDLFDVQDKQPHTYDYVMRSGDESMHFIQSAADAERITFPASYRGYDSLKYTTRSMETGPFRIAWENQTGALTMHVLEAPNETMTVFRSLAPGMTSRDYFAHLILRKEKAKQTTFRVVHEPSVGRSVLKAWLEKSQPDVTLIGVQGPHFRDWFIYRHDQPGPLTLEWEGQKIAIRGRYGWVRLRSNSIQLEGDIFELQVHPLTGQRITKAVYNDQPVNLQQSGGSITIHP